MAAKRIVLIENELLVAEHLQQLLTQQGHQVMGVEATGLGGILAVCQTRPDVVFLNVGLDGPMDGYETARQIRRISEVPILFVTAQSKHTVQEQADELNFQGCVTKPFSACQIHEAIALLFAPHTDGAAA